MSAKENKYTMEDLKAMQAWPLDRKIQVTQTRIMEWYLKFKGQVYVSFSGGKDSTVLLDMARRMFPDIPAVFIDTGLEYPEIRDFVKTIDNVTWLKPEMNFKKVITTYGYPLVSKEVSNNIYYAKKNIEQGKTTTRVQKLRGELKDNDGNPSRYNCDKWSSLLDAPFTVSSLCCDIMKKRPAHKYDKETGRKPIIATMADESRLRKMNWLHRGCNVFEGTHQSSQPMSFWTENDVLEYLDKYDIPYSSVYGNIVKGDNGDYYTTGCHRTGCIFCGYGCHLEKEPNRFQSLKETHPKLWNYCMKPVKDGGLGMRDVLEYINIKVD